MNGIRLIGPLSIFLSLLVGNAHAKPAAGSLGDKLKRKTGQSQEDTERSAEQDKNDPERRKAAKRFRKQQKDNAAKEKAMEESFGGKKTKHQSKKKSGEKRKSRLVFNENGYSKSQVKGFEGLFYLNKETQTRYRANLLMKSTPGQILLYCRGTTEVCTTYAKRLAKAGHKGRKLKTRVTPIKRKKKMAKK